MLFLQLQKKEYIMKRLQTLVVTKPNPHLAEFEKVLEGFEDIDHKIEFDEEVSVQAMSSQKFDLLIIDKNIPSATHRKLNRLAELLFPDAAIVTMHLGDKDFAGFKIGGLLLKWKDAQTEGQVNFLDTQ